MTFAQIKDLAFALPSPARNERNNAIQCMVIDAEESAMALGGEPMAILESNLCFCEDSAVTGWFVANCVKF